MASLAVFTMQGGNKADTRIPALQQAVASLTPGTGGGKALYSGSGNPNGVQIGNVGDSYNEITGGLFVATWVKQSGTGNSTGWI